VDVQGDLEVDYGPAPRRRGLRTGFTTGACAAAATKGACLALRGERPSAVVIPLPAGFDATFRLHTLVAGDRRARASVVKDAGDDPDVTHGAEIVAELDVSGSPPPGLRAGWRVVGRGAVARRLGATCALELRAGEGVGIVTRPGLGLPVGGPAINPVPRRMIARSLRESLRPPAPLVIVTIGVTDGETLARRTLNGRLGIEGGLSILGTTGVVRPYSTAAWRASVLQGVDVAAAAGCEEVVAGTGGRSEAYARRLLPDLPAVAFVEMGEFTGHLLRRARERGLRTVHLAGMVGKLSKIACGHFMTHVAGNQVDVAYLADLAVRSGAGPALVEAIRAANSARHAQELVTAARLGGYFDLLCADVASSCAGLIGDRPEVRVLLFDFEGRLLGRAPA
jgi:cobalt-precorrin-5B (C1)-methyltransferase